VERLSEREKEEIARLSAMGLPSRLIGAQIGRAARNVATSADPPRAERAEVRAWSPADVGKFLAHAADDPLSALWTLLLTTGLRRAEALGLAWADVDLDAGRLTVRQTLAYVGTEAVISETKTARSRRLVVLAPVTPRDRPQRLAARQPTRDLLAFTQRQSQPRCQLRPLRATRPPHRGLVCYARPIPRAPTIGVDLPRDRRRCPPQQEEVSGTPTGGRTP
jgi:integrase